MNQPTKDLFDDSKMSFGEHLEILRVHLIRAIIGLVIAVLVCLLNGATVVDFVRKPIDDALRRYADVEVTDDTENLRTWQNKLWEDWGLDVMFGDGKAEPDPEVEKEKRAHPDHIVVQVNVEDLAEALHTADPQRFPQQAQGDGKASEDAPQQISLKLRAPEFAQFQATVEQSRRPVTLNVQEAFLTYVKVSIVAGLILSSPWIFYQLWLFVAAGLYPHERKFVYLYGTLSLFLFVFGAVFCFYAVFPFVLKFLLSFNSVLKIQPQIRLSEWISFALMLPVMFGVSFQLPLAMLFLEKISIFKAEDYSEKRRMAILVIAILSMLLTPADPMSMLLMMFPLVGLYELGIVLCRYSPATNTPFDPAS